MSGREDELISRRAAIDLIKRMKPYHQDADDIAEMIDNMPAVEPDIITCVDCRYAGKEIADGRYWCNYHDGYMRYCGDAERRQ